MNHNSKQVFTLHKLLLCAAIVAVCTTSFLLGMKTGELQTKQETAHQTPAIVFTTAPDTTLPPDATPVVASRNGTKYHLPDCPGAGTIKEANLIRFASIHLAQSAGYTAAGNCAGLE